MLLIGSSFCLLLFLNGPELSNPYYLFGVGVTGFTVVFATVTLISVLLNRR